MAEQWETCEIEATSTPEGDGCRARFWAKASSPEGAYNAGGSESKQHILDRFQGLERHHAPEFKDFPLGQNALPWLFCHSIPLRKLCSQPGHALDSRTGVPRGPRWRRRRQCLCAKQFTASLFARACFRGFPAYCSHVYLGANDWDVHNAD